MAQIPLRNRRNEVIAHALVDRADYKRLLRFRWHLTAGGYVARAVGAGKTGKTYLHREVLGLAPGDGQEADHINRDKLDNRRANLRVVSNAENQQNVGARGRSRYRGVAWSSIERKWRASGRRDGQKVHLGWFDDEDEAGAAAAEFRREHMPFAVAGR